MRFILSLFSVFLMAFVNVLKQFFGKLLNSPIAIKRMLFLFSVLVSLFMLFTNNCIKALISSFGLFQFSDENAYRVRFLTPISTASTTTLLTDESPLLCP